MLNAHMLRERAERCRRIAKDYSGEVGAPLIEKAAALECEAARLERQSIERRAATVVA